MRHLKFTGLRGSRCQLDDLTQKLSLYCGRLHSRAENSTGNMSSVKLFSALFDESYTGTKSPVRIITDPLLFFGLEYSISRKSLHV